MKRCLILSIALILTSCGTVYKIPKKNGETLPWKTSFEIKQDQVAINKPYHGLADLDFIFLKTNTNWKVEKHNDFIMKSLDIMGFKNVLNEEGLTNDDN